MVVVYGLSISIFSEEEEWELWLNFSEISMVFYKAFKRL